MNFVCSFLYVSLIVDVDITYILNLCDLCWQSSYLCDYSWIVLVCFFNSLLITPRHCICYIMSLLYFHELSWCVFLIYLWNHTFITFEVIFLVMEIGGVFTLYYLWFFCVNYFDMFFQFILSHTSALHILHCEYFCFSWTIFICYLISDRKFFILCRHGSSLNLFTSVSLFLYKIWNFSSVQSLQKLSPALNELVLPIILHVIS